MISKLKGIGPEFALLGKNIPTICFRNQGIGQMVHQKDYQMVHFPDRKSYFYDTGRQNDHSNHTVLNKYYAMDWK